MLLLLRHVAAAICFASLVLCGAVRCDTINFSITGRENDGSELCPLTNSKISVYIPHQKDCGKFFICDNGIPYLRTCQPGLHFNPNLKACDYPESAGCDKSVLKKQKERMNDDDMDSCPAVNPKYPVLLPHPEDCSKFYICDSGNRHLKKCQSGLHFNPKIKSCDYPEKAGCDTGVKEEPKGRNIEDALESCPVVNSKHPVFLPHPEDCSKFYICDSGSRHLKQCQSGLHFNPKIKACDYPKNAGCDSGDAEKPKGKKTGYDLDLCPAENSEHPVLLPHPEECSKFYICDSGSPHLKVCQSGLHFNPKIKACDYPQNAGCDAGDAEKPKGKKTGDDDLNLCPAENSEHPVFLPHPEECSKFYICDSGSPRLKVCQSGLHFNPKIKACDYPENARCDAGDAEKPKGKKTGDDLDLCPAENSEHPVLLPHSEECNKFYICDSGSPRLKVCQPGLHFNPKIKACDYPENVGCDAEMTDKMAGVPSPFCPSRNGKIPIFFRHPTNCSVYYMCSNGRAYEFVCPARLHFNIRKKVCDYESNAGCRNADF